MSTRTFVQCAGIGDEMLCPQAIPPDERLPSYVPNLPPPEEIVAALKLEAGQTVADIGAGTGYMVAHLSKAVGKNGTVIAVDTESAMIEYLTKQLDELGPANIVTQKFSFHDPELKAESVDSVLILDTWHHMNERKLYTRKSTPG